MLSRLPTATLNLLLFRAGPQDFPWDGRINPWLVVGAALAVTLRYAVTEPVAVSAVVAGATMVGIAGATRTILRMRQLEARFQQTFHALLAVVCVINLLLLWPVAELAPASHQFMQAMQAGTPVDPQKLNAPASAGFLLLGLVAWNLAAWAFVFRHAAGVSGVASIVIAVVVTIGVRVFAELFGGLFALVTGLGTLPK